MRRYALLLLLSCALLPAQAPPAAGKVIKDSKNLCQVTIPPDWEPMADNPGAAIFKDPTTAIIVITAQPGQPFKPLTDYLLKVLDIPKERVFENSAKRIFYQERSSSNPETPNAYTASVPARNGSCSAHLVSLPLVSEETARKVVLSLSAVPE